MSHTQIADCFKRVITKSLKKKKKGFIKAVENVWPTYISWF